MNNKIKLYISAILLGLTSMIGQIIIIRELIVVFYGNELCLGIILATWLFWTSAGSFIAAKLPDKLVSKEKVLSAVQIALSILLPLNIFLIRVIKSILKVPAGEIMGFMPIVGSSFIALSSICLLLGFIFALISKLAAENPKTRPNEVTNIYLLEALGASIGGVVYSFFLITSFTVFQNILMIAGLNLVISLIFNRKIIQFVYLMILSAVFIFNWTGHLDRFTRSLQFRPFKLVESIDSIYGNISVTKLGKDFSFYENGLLVSTSGDMLTTEESVHYAMLEQALPKKILLIGGGISGAIDQILKHNVDKIDYLELDPSIIDLGEKYLGPIRNNKVNIITMDGRLFVKKYREKNSNGLYDVVILNLPDPSTAMLNRFYSVEFFGEVKKILSEDGVFSFYLSSSENYINPEQAIYLSCIYNTLQKEFRDIKLLPGDNLTFIASNKPGSLTYDSNVLIKRLKERKINTKFVKEYYLPFKLHPLRIRYIESALKEFGTKKINTDFKPIGYFYHTLLWASLFHANINLSSYLEKINVYLFILILSVLFLACLLLHKSGKISFKSAIASSIFLTGMSAICLQLIIMLAFQSLYGYMYYKVGLILTSFMIGIVSGSFYISKNISAKIKNEHSLYIKTQFYISIYPIFLALALLLIAHINQVRPAIGNNLQISFVILPVIFGFLGGFQFPLANKLCSGGSENPGKTIGFLYGIDLLGSCVGGLLVGIIFIPLLGIINTCLILAIVNSFILILLVRKG